MSNIFEGIFSFPNALMFLFSEDARLVQVPDIDGVASFWSTDSAWAVAVQHDADGHVQIRVGTDPPDDPSLALLHEGVLHSSRRLVEIQTVHIDTIARFRTWSNDSLISIWGDDPRQPERILIHCPDIAASAGMVKRGWILPHIPVDAG